MKRILSVFLLLLLLAVSQPALSQSAIGEVASLAIEFWPDYDQPSVLVLLKFTLPDGTQFPAAITLPLPEDATIHAVARNTAQGLMVDGISYDETVPGQVTITTSDPAFTVEYYVPYAMDGDRRSYTFSWQSDFSIDQLNVRVQQPVGAADMTVAPQPSSVTSGPEGLDYHELSQRTLQAGERFTMDISYTKASAELSAEQLAPQSQELLGPLDDAPAGSSGDSAIDWPIVALAMGVVLIAGAAIWYFAGASQQRRRLRKPRPLRQPVRGGAGSSFNRPDPDALSASDSEPFDTQADTPAPRFCHECGAPLDPDDRFCRSCGTRTKRG